ncbi:MAG: orotate phosphoribosyltransferase [Archaeoglobus sp.]|nr:orotate phosphoribosyltransferase [Archaeoglobus sp.]
MRMNEEKLIERMIEAECLKFGEFILSSGRKSNFYIDIKQASTYPDILEMIAEIVSEKIRDANIEYEKIACVELGGVPIAVAVSLKTKKPLLIFRKVKKDYGVKSDMIGELLEGEKVLVVEDVTTTGNSAYSVVERVRDKGGNVEAVIVIVDREEGAAEFFKEKEIPFLPILTASKLLAWK